MSKKLQLEPPDAVSGPRDGKQTLGEPGGVIANTLKVPEMELRVKVAGIVGKLQCYQRDDMVIIERKNWGWADHLGFEPVNWEQAHLCRDLGSVPDYPNDLNACAEFEKTLSWEQGVRYRIALAFNSDGRNAVFPSVEAALCHATAEQRCRAFVTTLEGPSLEQEGNEVL